MPSKPVFRFRAPGLLGRIGLALAAVGLVPLALASLQLARVSREELVEQLLRTHTVAARTAAEAIDAFLAEAAASSADEGSTDPRAVQA